MDKGSGFRRLKDVDLNMLIYIKFNDSGFRVSGLGKPAADVDERLEPSWRGEHIVGNLHDSGFKI